MGGQVLGAAALGGNGWHGMLGDFHQRAEAQMVDDKAPGEQRCQRLMGGIVDDGNGESRPGAGSVVNINQAFWLFFTENLQKGLGDPSFLLQKRLSKTSVEIAPARQLAQAE